jgi:hypothetical protein
VWEQSGNFELDDRFDIRVVVYRNVDLGWVQQRYPVVPGAADYRYIEYRAALRLLTEQGMLLRGVTNEPLAELSSALASTRLKILGALGPEVP